MEVLNVVRVCSLRIVVMHPKDPIKNMNAAPIFLYLFIWRFRIKTSGKINNIKSCTIALAQDA
jgi:hypothetical protein